VEFLVEICLKWSVVEVMLAIDSKFDVARIALLFAGYFVLLDADEE
jgi:hypothetical protein